MNLKTKIIRGYNVLCQVALIWRLEIMESKKGEPSSWKHRSGSTMIRMMYSGDRYCIETVSAYPRFLLA